MEIKKKEANGKLYREETHPNISSCKFFENKNMNSSKIIMINNKSKQKHQQCFSFLSKLDTFSILHKIMYDNFCFNVGDIVSLQNDDCTYYAQIIIFIEDSFCEKYAALIWLLPTMSSFEKSGFDPFTFTYGPQDESFYNMKEIHFVMHPPTDYFKRFIPFLPEISNITPIVREKFKPNSKRKI
ncbi:hypothetical protein PGB90_000696 [Kerria lacca]